MRAAALLIAATFLGGCASTEQARVAAPQHLFADARFGAPSEVIDTSQLFAVSPAMRGYLRSPRYREMVRNRGGQRGLIDALYKQGDLQLDYDATVTRPAAHTFDAKSGNCLSLVIMTAAFARELGYAATFQEVRVDETWSQQGSLQIASTHVNIVLGWQGTGNASKDLKTDLAADAFGDLFVVDFLPQQDAARHKAVPLREQDIVGMYANNRAVEALAAGRVTDAYWWARKALEEHPGLEVAYNTLGVVYQRHGDAPMAERTFREVLARDSANRMALQNLVPVLEAQGKVEEAQVARERLATLDPEPPFHYFQLGKAAMARNDFRAARDLFAREVARAPYYHEFHFWHALASLQLGETETARKELGLAQATSTTAANRTRYAAKLQHLHAMLPSAPVTR